MPTRSHLVAGIAVTSRQRSGIWQISLFSSVDFLILDRAARAANLRQQHLANHDTHRDFTYT